jgi:hypothetical protein
MSWKAEHRINTGYHTNPNQPINTSKPDNYYTYSRGTPKTNISGTLCFGAFNNNNGETYGTGDDAVLNQQDDVTHPTIYYINSGVNLGTHISGGQCSGAVFSSSG